MSVIKSFSSLEPNNYIVANSNEIKYTTDKKIKTNLIKLFNAFEEETTEFNFVEKDSYETYTDSLTVLHQRYESALKTHNAFVRFFLKLCWWRSSLCGSYNRCLKVAAKKIADKYAGNLFQILLPRYVLPNKVHRVVFRLAFEHVIKNLNTREITGFNWKVTNQMGVTSYLIGTIHRGTRHMQQQPFITEAIENAQTFFTEVGAYKAVENLKCGKYPYCLDGMIAKKALSQKKPIYALDNSSDELYGMLDQINLQTASPVTSELPKQTAPPDLTALFPHVSSRRMSKLKTQLKEYSFESMLEAWQVGHEATIGKIFKPHVTEDSDKRTLSWLNQSWTAYPIGLKCPGLIEAIQNATKPILIAVGTGHCVGLGVSLVKKFDEAGFKVVRVM